MQDPTLTTTAYHLQEKLLKFYTLVVPFCLTRTNLLINNKGLALNRKDLNSILKLGNNAIDINLALIVDKGVIAKIKVGRSIQYYMNPKVAYKGSKISNSLIELFGN